MDVIDYFDILGIFSIVVNVLDACIVLNSDIFLNFLYYLSIGHV